MSAEYDDCMTRWLNPRLTNDDDEPIEPGDVLDAEEMAADARHEGSLVWQRMQALRARRSA